MPAERQFFLKWKRKSPERKLKDPEKFEGEEAFFRRIEPKHEDYVHVNRLIAVSVLYYAPGEYVDPITHHPVPNGIVDVLEREAEATHDWKRHRRIEVRRQVWSQVNPTDRWSPVNKYNSLHGNGGMIVEEMTYDFIAGDRSLWHPVYWTPLLAQPLAIYVRREGNLDRLWLSSGRHLYDGWKQRQAEAEHELEFLEGVQVAPEYQDIHDWKVAHWTREKKMAEAVAGIGAVKDPDWRYPGLADGQTMPESVDAKQYRVRFGKIVFPKTKPRKK